MINQRAYPDILLGFGTGAQTIANYGCYFVALLDDLIARFGYNFTVKQFNDYLKEREAWVRPNLIDAAKLARQCAEIFEWGRSEAWNDAKVIEYLVTNRDQYIVIGEVDARGIGGSGQHFVKLDSVDVSNGKITMTRIDDGWDGLENQKVTTRYNAYGNIKSLRVFKVKKLGGSMVQVEDAKFAELVKKSTHRDSVWAYLGLDTNVDDKGVISVIAGLKSRITDLGNQLANVLDLEWEGSDGVKRKLSWYVAEAVNRTEQVGVLKEQLLNAEKDQKALSIQLKKLQETSGADVSYWTGRVSDLEGQVKQLGIDKGDLNTKIVEMQKAEKEYQIKIDTLTEQLNDKAQVVADQLAVPQLVSALLKKLLSGKWS